MSSSKRDSGVISKNRPSEGKCQKSNVRVGAEFQIAIPDFAETRPANYCNERSERETCVWNPKLSPPSSDIEAYIVEANKYSYPLDAALALLHYHKYSIQSAIDDLPNYEPMLNRYTKCGVKNFLKSVDGRPRKDFARVSRDFLGYTMGEIQGLYYAIAAPFKAGSRRGAKYALQMRNYYQKALKLGFTASYSAPDLHKCEMDADEEVADAQFEEYFHQIMCVDRARKLCKSVIQGRPYSSRITSNGSGNGAKGSSEASRWRMGANGAFVSNRPQIFTESLGRMGHKQTKGARSTLQNFNLHQFIEFTHKSDSEVDVEFSNWYLKLAQMDEELKSHEKEIMTTNEGIFKDLDSFYPRNRFENLIHSYTAPFYCHLRLLFRVAGLIAQVELDLLILMATESEVTFRWTKSELAILVMALDAYGKDFAQIAQIMGTKTESMIRDFYNKYNVRFGLDAFTGKEKKEAREERGDGVVVSDGVVESAGGGVENEVMKSDEPALIMDSVQRRGTQSNSNSPQMSGVAGSSHEANKSPEEDGVEEELGEETKDTKEEVAVLEVEETEGEVVVKPELIEVKKEDDSGTGNGKPRWRRGRPRKETPVRRVSTRSLSNESPAGGVRRRSSKSVEAVETPRGQRKSYTPTTVESPVRRPRGRPSLKALAENVQKSSPSGGLLKGDKGDQGGSTTKTKAKESAAVASKRKASIVAQKASEVAKKRARNSTVYPRSSRLRR
ncbi:unnamed protein product [Rodentolepis nana]|uniref:SANT domain-containing protein n=1 Tax=Rodentolepis nana TaxID=102285 RepID=A0A0R3T690_RODNA|nr:unnamed protein product [Rodentolepis nana]